MNTCISYLWKYNKKEHFRKSTIWSLSFIVHLNNSLNQLLVVVKKASDVHVSRYTWFVITEFWNNMRSKKEIASLKTLYKICKIMLFFVDSATTISKIMQRHLYHEKASSVYSSFSNIILTKSIKQVLKLFRLLLSLKEDELKKNYRSSISWHYCINKIKFIISSTVVFVTGIAKSTNWSSMNFFLTINLNY